MVEKQLKELTSKVKMKNVEQTEEVQLEQLKGALKIVKKRFKEVKRELKKCYESQSSTEDEEEYEVEGGEGKQRYPNQSSPIDRSRNESKMHEKE